MLELWIRVIEAKHPGIASDTHRAVYLMQEAALEWGAGLETENSRLFDQYVMLKTLTKPNEL